MQNHLVFILFLLAASCAPTSKGIDKTITSAKKDSISAIELLSNEEGLAALRLNCYTCHNPRSASHEAMLAPPLAGIKARYASLYPEREVFIAQMASFVQHPDKDKAIMKGPVRRFGLMPATPLDEQKILEIVAYIYDQHLEIPSWFEEHYEEEHGKKWQN